MRIYVLFSMIAALLHSEGASAAFRFEDPWLPYPPQNISRFDSNGALLVSLGDDEGARDAIWTNDNKLLVVGWASNGTHSDQILMRFWPDGSLDEGFGTGGVLVGALGADALVHGVVEDASGNYVTVGRYVNGDSNFLVSRYLTDGSLDPTFGTGGQTEIDFGPGQQDSGRDIVIDGSGRIVVAGFTQSAGQWDFAVARLTAAGAPDAAFNGTGMVQTDFPAGGNDDAYALTVDAADKIWVVGRATNGNGNEDFGMVLYGTQGTVEAQVSTDSPGNPPANSNDRAWAIAADASGSMFAIGRAYNSNVTEWQLSMVRYSPVGAVENNSSLNRLTGIVGRNMIYDPSQDRFMVGGHTFDGNDWNMMVGKLTTAGTAPNGFGTNGIASFTNPDFNDNGMGLVYERDKLFVVGFSGNGTDKDFMIVRVDSNGSLANSGKKDQWAGAGGVTQDIQGDADFAFSMDVDSSYNVITVGLTENGDATTRDSALVMWNSDGSLRTGFNATGILTHAFSTADSEQLMKVRFDHLGRAVAVGWAEFGAAVTRDSTLVRVLTDGSFDNSFSGDGRVQIDIPGDSDRDELQGFQFDASNRIVAVGSVELTNAVSREMVLIRFNTDGSHDAGWAGGFATTNYAGETFGTAVATDGQGRYVVVGNTEANGGTTVADRNVAIARFRTDGTLDPSFNLTGMVTTALSTNEQDEAYGITMDAQDRIYVAGTVYVGGIQDAAVIRYLSNGSLDAAFNGTGFMTYDRGGVDQAAHDLIIQPNGKIMVLGWDQNDVLMMRLHTDGSLDTSFGTGGVAKINNNGQDIFWDFRSMPDGRFVLAGRSGQDFGYFRVWP